MVMFTYYDEKLNRLRDTATGRFAPFAAAVGPDETCLNGCERVRRLVDSRGLSYAPTGR